ncbi:MAG TPA: TIGR03619 family F420-dependent LLM class oxidoreductase [Anaerolineae bacterium]|jgi:probable F420-dependent oxidoreductase|nr:TIGR03619 family F420-dependent LLM class oxidoreductase [Anaerolineae bacterium]
MRFGINILNFGPGTGPESLARWAGFAEEVGYHLIMISDHVAVTPDVQDGFPAPFYDPFVSLSWLANIATRVELGTTVIILPYRHPLLTARLAANIDNLSGGRFILGTGVGWAKQEFAALGVPFGKRGVLADEYLEVIRLCWANEVVSYEGQFVSFKDVHTGPRPLRPAGLPIWVGGSSDAAIKRAVRFGDAWHPYRFTLEWLKDEALPKQRRLAEAEGKPVPAFCPRFSLQLTDETLPEGQRRPGHGSIEQIHADLKVFASLGAEYILLDTYTGLPGQTEQPEEDWKILAMIADQVLDLPNETVR